MEFRLKVNAAHNSPARAVTADAARNFQAYDFAGGAAVLFTAAAPWKKTAPNEDRAALISCGKGCGVLAVTDGLGGLPAGREASDTVIAALVRELSGTGRRGAALDAAVEAALQSANRALLAGGLGNACTIGTAVVEGLTVRAGHAGDTEVLVTNPRGGRKFRTAAHSPSGAALGSGALSEEQALRHPQRNIVNNVIGGADFYLEAGDAVALAAGDTVTVASDGLWDNFYEREISHMICAAKLPEAAANLAAAAARRMAGGDGDGLPGHADDLTFILYRPNL
ncbi:MAG: protein phosphatase 2C domain-containing protein [Gammaproteobacteria bacterium]|nr:protein phosphatase 2C domain-containing protein [Gammaproteobacteria bacterium]